MAATYRAPVADTMFVLQHVVKLGKLVDLPRFREATPELTQAILEEGARFVEGVLAPLNPVGDREGCTRHEDGTVTTPTGFRDAYEQFVAAGWNTLTAPPEFGGQGLPHVVGTAFEEYLCSANMAFGMYPGLTQAAVRALVATGSAELQRQWLPNMVSGRWTGTMNLTEPHAGTDLGLIRTKAEPASDGSWRITGTKIFISAGEHDMAENIVHLVLARTPGAPEGSKGISLFLVPKFLLDPDGSPGERNKVTCGAIEHKMGIHGNATCVMNHDGATGWLVGEENKGLRAMFVMMNVARLGVGLQGLGQSEVAMQNAAAYARERLQGRALVPRPGNQAQADPLIVQPDVRRMLLDARAFNEAARALSLWMALQADLAEGAPDADQREKAEDLLSLLTPVAKAYLTDEAYVHATNAQQIFGGHGYIVETGVEQFVRDARIAMIYEGANAVQAMDLVGRKLAANGGRALRALLQLVDEGIEAAADDAVFASAAKSLGWAKGKLEAATMWLMQNALSNPENAGAAAVPYLRILGLVTFGHLWLQMMQAARSELEKEGANHPFLEAKLITGRHFFERTLPEVAALSRRVEAGSETLMAMPAESF